MAMAMTGKNLLGNSNHNVISKNSSYASLMEQAISISEGLENVEPLQFVSNKYKKIYTVSRAVSNNNSCSEFETGFINNEQNYGGAFYSNRFCTNRQIFLYEIGFYGPSQLSESAYNVHVEIFEPKNSKQFYPKHSPAQCIFRRQWRCVVGKRNEIFYVQLLNENQSPIFIEANKWYLIQFKLEGEPTQRCQSTLNHVSVPLINSKNESIKFRFNNGSMQMPELKFSLI